MLAADERVGVDVAGRRVRSSATVAWAASLSGASRQGGVEADQAVDDDGLGGPSPGGPACSPLNGTTAVTPSTPPAASATSRPALLRREHVGRGGRHRRRSGGSSASWPVADGDPPRTDVRQRDAVGVESRARRLPARTARPGSRRAPARAAADRAPRPAPSRGRWACSLPYCGRNGQNAARPSRTRAAGRKVSAASTARAMLTAEIGPRPRLEPRSEKSRQRTPRIDRRAGGDDRLPRLPQRDAASRRTSTAPAQFLAVAGDQQQAVVGGRADDEDRGDALALPVDRDPALLRRGGRRRRWRP